MSFFNARKRPDPPPDEPVDEVAPAPVTSAPTHSQFSSAPLGAALRLVSTPEPELRLAEAPAREPETAADRAADLRGLPLGTILYRQGLVQQSELEEALASGMQSGERLGEILIRRGLISEEDIARGLAAQQGLPLFAREELALDAEVAALIPVDEARDLGTIAVRSEDDGVLVVTPDPSARQRAALEERLHRSVTEGVVTKSVFDGLLHEIEQLAAEPVHEAPEDHPEPKEEAVEQTWTDAPEAEAAADEQPSHEWGGEPSAVESWSEPEAEHEVAPEWEHRPEAEHQPELGWEHQPEPEAEHQPEPLAQAEVGELDARHDASVGRIGELIARIEEGASTFADLRARIGGLTESLHAAEENVADRDRRLSELTEGHEVDQRRIEELVSQLHEREEELRGVGGRIDDLSGRLVSAEERLDERERRLEDLFRQVERRDSALAAFEQKLDAIASQFAAVDG